MSGGVQVWLPNTDELRGYDVALLRVGMWLTEALMNDPNADVEGTIDAVFVRAYAAATPTRSQPHPDARDAPGVLMKLLMDHAGEEGWGGSG